MKLIGGIEVLQHYVVFLIPRVDFLYCWMSHLSLCFLKGVHKGKFWECLQSAISNRLTETSIISPTRKHARDRLRFWCLNLSSIHAVMFTPESLSFIHIYPYQPSPYQTKFIQILWSVPLWMKLIFTNQTKFYQTYHCQLIYPTHLYQSCSYPTSLRPTCLSFLFCHLCLTEPISVPNPPSPITY